MRFIQDSPVLSEPGTYLLRLLDAKDALLWLSNGLFLSRAGGPAVPAAEALSGRTLKRVYKPALMQLGDECLVISPKRGVRVPSRATKSLTQGFVLDNFEFQLLRRIA